MNSKGQCQKSADNAAFNDMNIRRFAPVIHPPLSDAEIRLKLESSSEYSESLVNIIESSAAVSVILSRSASPTVAETVLEMCGGKLVSIYIADETPLYTSPRINAIIEKYSEYVATVDKDNTDLFDYYGASSSKAPLLFHKSITDCGTIIAVSDTNFDNVAGYTGGAGAVFAAFAAHKTEERALAKCLDNAETGKLPECRAGNIKFNPASECRIESVITTSRKITWFGVSTINDAEGNPTFISAGDLLLSSAYAQSEFKIRCTFEIAEPFDGVFANVNTESLPELAAAIERLTAALVKGGRLFINAPKLSTSGSESYKEIFNTSSLHEIYEKIETTGSQEYMSAYMLKKLASQYHIAVCTNFDTQTLRQAGLNPAQESAEEFLKNCHNIGYIENATRFAKQ